MSSVVSSSRPGSGRGRQRFFAHNHKTFMEEAMVRRREAARVRNEFWSSTAKYFDRIDKQNEKFESWTSPGTSEKSRDAYRKSKMAETRQATLPFRRERLKAKLLAEDEANLEQIRRMPAGTKRKSLKDVREEYEQMRLRRMEEQQKEAQEKMLQHWRINNPEYRELQCKKRYEMVQKAWDTQKAERAEAESAERRREEIRIRVEAEEAVRREAEGREAEKERAQKLAEWKSAIMSQVAELKSRRLEEDRIRTELAEQHEREKRLAEVEAKRRRVDERRRKRDYREFLSRQHRLKLLQRAQMVQKELDEDARLMDEVGRVEDPDDAGVRAEKNERLAWMANVVEQQKAEERRREKEMESLFSEEAEKMWRKQEAVWKREEDARKRLLDDVYAGVREQIRAKLQEKEREHKMVQSERERIEEAIERLSSDIQNEEKALREKKAMFVEDLDEQVKAKNDREAPAKSFRETNELASKLVSSWKVSPSEPVISDFRRKKVKWI